ncbi:MAG: hypothetical protein ACXVC6_03850 [Bacteroidia bacterium]
MHLNKGVFQDLKFKFSVVSFLDGRLNTEKPSGYYFDKLNNKRETIGVDSLSKELNSFFAKSASFDSSNKFILVLNQLNYKETEYKVHYFDLTIAIDYYKVAGNKCVLFYRQYYNYFDKSGFERVKVLNDHFSVTLIKAFREFEDQLRLFKVISTDIYDTTNLISSLKGKPSREITNQNLKEGLYFNVKELYLNQPGYTSEYFMSDTSNLGDESISLMAKDYLLNQVYAIVLHKKMYINIGNGFYTYAEINNNGDLILKVDMRKIKNTNSKIPAAEITSWIMVGAAAPLLQYAMVRSATANSRKVKDRMSLKIDFETGQLSSWGIGISR